MSKFLNFTAAVIVVFLLAPSIKASSDISFRFGIEHGVLFPVDSSLYDGKDTIQFPDLKEGLYWPNGWGVEFSQRLISPDNRFLGYGVHTTDGIKLGEGDRSHLRYILPLVLSLRYDFQKDKEAFFHPYITGGLGVYYTVKEFERTMPPTVIDKVDRQAPIGPFFSLGLEILRSRVKIATELKYELFRLNETFEGSGDDGTGGGPSFSIGVIF